MAITTKDFKITSLSDQGKEFIIEERLFIFNQPITHKIHTQEEGMPFLDYFSAKKVKEKLEKRENNCTFVQREGVICLTLILVGLCLIACSVFI